MMQGKDAPRLSMPLLGALLLPLLFVAATSLAVAGPELSTMFVTGKMIALKAGSSASTG